MSAFKIGGSLFRPMGGVSSNKKPEPAADEKEAASPKGAYDTVNFHANRLAVMPRMSIIGGQTAQHLQSETVESLLKDSASELDDYFSKAYGFDKESE